MNASITEFVESIANDKEVKARFEALYENHKNSSEPEVLIVNFAKTEGFSFTAEEFMRYIQKNRELNEKELEMVSGGIKIHNDDEDHDFGFSDVWEIMKVVWKFM